MKEIITNMEDCVWHDVQLVEAKLISLNCEVKDKEDSAATDIITNMAITTKGIAIDESEGYADISINLDSEIFSFKIIQRGEFKIKNNEKIPVEKFEKFLATQGIRILWSYARETVFEISCKMLRKPIMLPTLDVIRTLENSKEQDKKEEQAGIKK
ncbi:MAG: protein-export chaperone SecB [Lachnospiraceae bacterium]|nr:protein-export chaperone SecB [Lachnospiraceae bacterium]